jgi:hypothetical protein
MAERSRVSQYVAGVAAIAAYAIAVALPWELRTAVENIVRCSGARSFLGTGPILVVPLYLSLALITNAVVVARAVRRGDATPASSLVLFTTMLPGAIAWSFLHRCLCVGDAFPYQPPLTSDEQALVPLVLSALEYRTAVVAGLVAWTVSALALAAGAAFWSAGETRVAHPGAHSTPGSGD